jgi:hypothetical protein
MYDIELIDWEGKHVTGLMVEDDFFQEVWLQGKLMSIILIKPLIFPPSKRLTTITHFHVSNAEKGLYFKLWPLEASCPVDSHNSLSVMSQGIFLHVNELEET